MGRIPGYIKWPDRANIGHLREERVVSMLMLLLNALSSAVLTTGVLATLYGAILILIYGQHQLLCRDWSTALLPS